MHGVSGSVGSFVTQQAMANPMRVVGTVSERIRTFAESLGARVADYRDPNCPRWCPNSPLAVPAPVSTKKGPSGPF